MHLKCIRNPSHSDPSKIHQYLIKPFALFNQLNQKNSDATSKKYSNNQYSHHEFSICTCSLFVIFLDYNIKINWSEGGASQEGGEEKEKYYSQHEFRGIIQFVLYKKVHIIHSIFCVNSFKVFASFLLQSKLKLLLEFFFLSIFLLRNCMQINVPYWEKVLNGDRWMALVRGKFMEFSLRIQKLFFW